MNSHDISIYNIRMKHIKLCIGDAKTCSSCKKNINGTYFTSLDGNTITNGGYETCVLCRIIKNNKRYDNLMLKRGYCNFDKLEPIIVEGNYIKSKILSNN